MKNALPPLDRQMNIRLDAEDKKIIERAARKAKRKPSAFVRWAALHCAKLQAEAYKGD